MWHPYAVYAKHPRLNTEKVSGYAYISILIDVSAVAEIYLKYPVLEIKTVRTGAHVVPHGKHL